jgi:hypothetical protein
MPKSPSLVITVFKLNCGCQVCRSAVSTTVAFTVIGVALPEGEKFQDPVIVGAIACDNAGAPSERMNVVKTPGWLDRVICAVGAAPWEPR